MKEAGYARQPLRWISTQEYDFMYKGSLVAKQQLEELGFAIDLQVVDWATLNPRVQKPELWDTYVTGYPLFPDPATRVSFRCTFQGWWCNEECCKRTRRHPSIGAHRPPAGDRNPSRGG